MIVTRPSFRWVTVGIWLMPLTFAATAICLLGAFWREVCLRWQSGEVRLRPRSVVGWLWCLLLALGAISTACSVTPVASIPSWLGGLGYAVTFVVATWTVITPGRLKQLHKAIFGVAVAMAIAGLAIYAADIHVLYHASPNFEIKLGTDDNRINSVMYHPNLLAGFLVLAMATGLGLFHQMASRWRRAAYAGGLSILALCLVLTSSRAGWIGAGCLLIAFGFLIDRRWLLVAVGGGASAVAVFPGLVITRLAALSWDNPAFDKYRVMGWISAWQMLKEHPWFGWGPGTWGTIYPIYALPEETTNLPHAHNYFLHVGVEFGVLVVLTLVAIVVWVCYRGVRDTTHTQYHLPVMATVCGIFGYAVVNMFDYTLSEGRNAMAFFLLVGGVEAARRMALADRPPELRVVIPAATASFPEDSG